MPASTSLVSLDHAKHWARRLAKAQPAIASLAQAQEAVAQMLGHASWHALTRFYDTPATANAVVAADTIETDNPRDPLFAPSLRLINTKHPGLNAQMVEVLAIETDEIEGGGSQLQETRREFEGQGYYSDDALDKAIEQLSVRIHAPPGHSMIRVRDAQDKATLVVVSHEDYRRVMPAPARKQAQWVHSAVD